MTLTTPTPIGSGSPPVGEARAAGARANSVRASVRLRATCLDMEFLLRSADCAEGRVGNMSEPAVYLSSSRLIRHGWMVLSRYLLIWLSDGGSAASILLVYPAPHGRGVSAT